MTSDLFRSVARKSTMRTLVLPVLLVAVALAGCGRETAEDTASVPNGTVPEAQTYVAIGASESVGVGSDDPATQAWPVVLHRTSMVSTTKFVNVAVAGSTTKAALTDQLPKALAEKPDIVTIWLNVNDLISLVSPQAYKTDLLSIVTQLKEGGAEQILVANTPAVQDLPVFANLAAGKGGTGVASSFVPSAEVVAAQVAAYNTAIDEVVEQTGSVLVDLNAAYGRAIQDGTAASYVSSDGFHPSTAGHQFVAQQFADAANAGMQTNEDN